MRAGTKSVLFGVHQFLIHPLVVAAGWRRAYGWRRVAIAEGVTTSLLDPRLWCAFVVHDIGLLGKPDMDGPVGETHPEVGALIMRRLFGPAWGDLVLLHSRYYSKRLGRPVSPLCIADKWAIVVEPSWLYLPRAWASGELGEYLANARKRATGDRSGLTPAEAEAFLAGPARAWHAGIKSYMRRWLDEHSDGRADTWTKVRHA